MPLAWRAPLGTEAAPGRPRAGSRERSSQPVASALDGGGRRSPIKWSSFVVPPEDPRPPLGYIVRVENMEAQHIHHPNVLVVADDPAELRAIEAALDVRITQVSRQLQMTLSHLGPRRRIGASFAAHRRRCQSIGHLRVSRLPP